VALTRNDLVEVVEILAKRPELAQMPLGDGTYELPLKRALDLDCDRAVIDVLQGFGAEDSVSDDTSDHLLPDLMPDFDSCA